MLLIDTWDRVGTGMYFEVYITPGTERIIHYQVPGTWYIILVLSGIYKNTRRRI